MSHTKFGPDRFSRFDVYWIQTDKPNLYIDDMWLDLSCPIWIICELPLLSVLNNLWSTSLVLSVLSVRYTSCPICIICEFLFLSVLNNLWSTSLLSYLFCRWATPCVLSVLSVSYPTYPVCAVNSELQEVKCIVWSKVYIVKWSYIKYQALKWI